MRNETNVPGVTARVGDSRIQKQVKVLKPTPSLLYTSLPTTNTEIIFRCSVLGG